MNGWIIAGIAAVVLLVWVAGCYWITVRMFEDTCCRNKPPRSDESYLERLAATPLAHRVEAVRQGMGWFARTHHEEWTLTARDGVKLSARWYPNDHWNGKVVLLFHGYHSNAEHDFHLLCPVYQKMGFHLLVADQRSHGRSEGTYICFAGKERFDAVDWCRTVLNRVGDCPLVLSGLSMGASTVLMAAGLPEAPPQLMAVVADCGFINAYDQFRHVLRQRYRLPAFPLLPMCDALCRHRAGFSLRGQNTLDALEQIRVPVLLIHGKEDHFVPAENAVKMHEAFPEKTELVLVKDAGHGMGWIGDEDACRAALERLLQRAEN